MLAVSEHCCDSSHSNPSSILPLLPLPFPRFKMEKWQTDFFFCFPSLLTLSLGSSFSSLSALSVPCAVWRCVLLPPWQGTLFHRCSQNLWPNVMLPLWANKMGQLVFRVIITTTIMIMLTEFLPLLKKIIIQWQITFVVTQSQPVMNFSPFSLIMLSHHMVPARRQGGYSSHYKILVKTLGFSSVPFYQWVLGSCSGFVNPVHHWYLRHGNERKVRIYHSEDLRSSLWCFTSLSLKEEYPSTPGESYGDNIHFSIFT